MCAYTYRHTSSYQTWPLGHALEFSRETEPIYTYVHIYIKQETSYYRYRLHVYTHIKHTHTLIIWRLENPKFAELMPQF